MTVALHLVSYTTGCLLEGRGFGKKPEPSHSPTPVTQSKQLPPGRAVQTAEIAAAEILAGQNSVPLTYPSLASQALDRHTKWMGGMCPQ